MLRTLALAAAALAGSLVPGAARAGALLTSPIYVSTDRTITCELVNLGEKSARDVVVQVVRFEIGMPGSIELASTPADLEPLGSRSSAVGNVGPERFYACRFLFKGSGKALRGTALLTDSGATILDSQAAR